MPKCPTPGARYQEKLQNKATPSIHDDRKETDQENHPCEPKYHLHTNHHTRNKQIPPARICAARRLPRDVSARSPDRSARCFLDTADASPPNRSVSAPWQVSAAFVQLEPHRSAGRSARSARTAPDRRAAAVPFSVATQPLATRLGNSGRLMLACSLCPGPLGPATVTDDRHRQARTLVRWTKWRCSCYVARCPPLSSSRHSPQNLVCLAELSRSHLSDPFLPALGVPVRI